MPRRKWNVEKIIPMLRQAEVEIAKGISVTEVCRQLAIHEQQYYKWRKMYGGLKLDQAKYLKVLEKENDRLKRVVADLTLDNQILKEAARGNY
jgi:transposase-like protein